MAKISSSLLKMMRYNLDLHLHTDYDPATDKRHGERPDKLAAAIVEGDLDAAVIVEHDNVSERALQVRDEVEQIRHNLARQRGTVRKEVYIGLGVEMTLVFEDSVYHVGYAFEEEFGPNNFPSIPDRRSDISAVDKLRKIHPGVATLFHPCWQDDRRNTKEKTLALASSGLFDALEILNAKALKSLDHDGESTAKRDRRTRIKNVTKANLETYLAARKKLSGERHLAAVGCSDAHRQNDMIGKVFTEFSGQSPSDFFKAIQRGQTLCVSTANGSVRSSLRSLLGTNGSGRFMRIR